MCGPVKHQITSSMGGSSLDTDRSKTVSNPYLSSPDELEGDNMHVGKLRSSVTTSGHTQDACELRQRRFLRFYTPQHPNTAGTPE